MLSVLFMDLRLKVVDISIAAFTNNRKEKWLRFTTGARNLYVDNMSISIADFIILQN